MAEIFTWPVRVYYEDTDVSGVVYHANYLRYLERARTEWLRTKSLSQEALRLQHGIAFTVANMQIDFLVPARLDDALEVTVELNTRKRASLVFGQTVQRADRAVLCKANVRIACVDVLNFKPCVLPELGF